MRLPRDLAGRDLAKALAKLGYQVTRQTGSHMRLTTTEQGEHHITIPNHTSLRIGTLAAILSEVAVHFQFSRDELIQKLFGEIASGSRRGLQTFGPFGGNGNLT